MDALDSALRDVVTTPPHPPRYVGLCNAQFRAGWEVAIQSRIVGDQPEPDTTELTAGDSTSHLFSEEHTGHCAAKLWGIPMLDHVVVGTGSYWLEVSAIRERITFTPRGGSALSSATLRMPTPGRAGESKSSPQTRGPQCLEQEFM